MKIPVGRIWPSGEFSQGYRSLPGDERLDGRPVSFRSHRYPLSQGGSAPEAPRPLDLGDASKSHRAQKSRPQRGLKGITSYGKKMIKSVGALLQHDSQIARVTLATLTLPGMSARARRRLYQAWPELTRQLIQWLGRRLRRAGLPPVVAACSEIQPSRLAKTNEAWLHLHVLWPNRHARRGRWSVDVSELRAWFHAAVDRLSGERLVQTPNVDVKAPRGDVASYLAKYLSKGSVEAEIIATELGLDAVPRTWWNLSAAARRWVHAQLIHGDSVGAFLEHAINAVLFEGATPWWCYLREVAITVEDREVPVGWRGAVKSAEFPGLRVLLTCS